MPLLIATIFSSELDALVRLALAELSNPRDQVRYILRRELHRRKLISEDTEPQKFGDHLKGAKDE